MHIIPRLTAIATPALSRSFSVSSAYNANYTCKLLVVGGGSGGCTMAAKFARRLPKDSVIVLEPSKDHYYQPLWTLVGAGISSVEATRRDEASVLPRNTVWIRDYAYFLHPDKNTVETKEGHTIQYEYMIVAVGIENYYEKVPGLCEALQDRNSGVSTIFSPDYVEKTWSNIQNFKGGNAIFTYPNSLIKCPGAPQKIMYLAESYFNKSNVRSKSKVVYNTCLPVMFGVKKYNDVLEKVRKRKNIDVNFRYILKEVRPDKREAVFYYKTHPDKDIVMPYDLLHVSPPMRTPEFLRCCTELVDKAGFLDVDKYTLQHTKYKNIYGIGDCTNTPNSKTAAAIAKQCYVVEHNLIATMKKDNPKEKYNGYGACPLVTSYHTVVMAEFLYDGVIRETLPINQARESILAFYMKRHLFPFLYWNVMLKGYYHGPEMIRTLLNPFRK